MVLPKIFCSFMASLKQIVMKTQKIINNNTYSRRGARNFAIILILCFSLFQISNIHAQTFTYDNETNCDYKLIVISTNSTCPNAAACATTLGPIPANSFGTLTLAIPSGCPQTLLCALQVSEVNGGGTTPRHRCATDEDEFLTSIVCGADVGVNFYNCYEVKIYYLP